MRTRWTPFHVVFPIPLLALAIGINTATLSHRFGALTQDGQMILATKVLVWFFQAFCAGTAGLIYFKGRTPVQRRKLMFAYILSAFMVVAIEMSLHLCNLVMPLNPPPRQTLKNHWLLPEYRNQEWVSVLYKETHEIPATYEPFLGWYRRSYQGSYLNVDAEGARKTWNPPTSDSALKVFAFGGSTLWGHGARDDHTIPSYLSQFLNDGSSQCFHIWNYGQPGHCFIQGVLKLALLLRQGHRPDYVLFYDGANDVYSAYHSGRAGVAENLEQMKRKLAFPGHTPEQHLVLAFKGFLTQRCMLYRVARRLFEAAARGRRFPEIGAKYSDKQVQLLGQDISTYYLDSLDLLSRLAIAYEFGYQCFWQPTLAMEKKLIPPEDDPEYNPRAYDVHLQKLHSIVLERLTSEAPRNFYDITEALHGREFPVYLDFCHISERGNEIVARRIADIVTESARSALKED